MKQGAIYVSEWDSAEDVRTLCLISFAVSPPVVSNIDTLEDEDRGVLVREYVELYDGTKVDTFFNDDTSQSIIDGVAEEEEY